MDSFKHIHRSLACGLASLAIVPVASAVIVDLGGPDAVGYIALTNFKNWGTATDAVNGLPDYPYYQVPPGDPNAGVFTSVIAGPLSAASDYSPINGGVQNASVTQFGFGTFSSGQLSFADGLLTGSGVEVIAPGNLVFDFDTFDYDGAKGGVAGPISPLSPIQTPYNDGGGSGNAAVWYNLSVSNLSGAGLTFVDGILGSADLSADLNVQATSALSPALTQGFAGTLTLSGLDYAFAVDATEDFPAVFTDVRLFMNRTGSLSVIPEPSTYALLVSALALGLACRRNRN